MRLMPKILIVACGLGFLLTACSGAGGSRIADRPDEPLDFIIEEDVPYTPQLALDVYYPATEGPWPVAVVLHGGEDHKSTMYAYGRAAARLGVVAFVPEWRSFPAQLEEDRLGPLEDVACAIRFARDSAGDFGGDGERIIMAGWSLGGGFAAIAALRTDPVEADCIVGAEVSTRVHGLVGLDAVYDFAELWDEPTSWTQGEIDEISAQPYVRPWEGDDPPAFRLFTGQVEELHAQAERFRDALEGAGYAVELVRHADRSHAGVILAPGTDDALADLAFR
jgi:acetyl esterase/lipase